MGDDDPCCWSNLGSDRWLELPSSLLLGAGRVSLLLLSVLGRLILLPCDDYDSLSSY